MKYFETRTRREGAERAQVRLGVRGWQTNPGARTEGRLEQKRAGRAAHNSWERPSGDRPTGFQM